MDSQMDRAPLSSTAAQFFCWTKCALLDQMVSSSSQIPSGAESGCCSEPGNEHGSMLCNQGRHLPLLSVPAPDTGATTGPGFVPSHSEAPQQATPNCVLNMKSESLDPCCAAHPPA